MHDPWNKSFELAQSRDIGFDIDFGRPGTTIIQIWL